MGVCEEEGVPLGVPVGEGVALGVTVGEGVLEALGGTAGPLPPPQKKVAGQRTPAAVVDPTSQ